jgi:hypothetical protein
MTVFGWMVEAFDEYTSLIGIGMVLVVLGLAAAMFSHRLSLERAIAA